MNRISYLKNRIITPDAYKRNSEFIQADYKNGTEHFSDIYRDYVLRCGQAEALDFDDILLSTYFLFSNCSDVLLRYEERFKFVLVDEYQDTNYIQHAIVWLLTQRHQRLCVVGDDAQSIYSFRGANIDNILTFQKLFQNAKLFKLEQNYRSTQTIVGAANSLISHNRGQIPKLIYSEKAKGQPIHVCQFCSDLEEAAAVAKKVVNLNNYDHISWKDMAILYRTNAQSRSFEEAFRKQEIPYQVYGGLSFYQRKEIKDMIAYFRLAVNPNDEEALKRVINYPARGIGQTSVNRIIASAAENGVSVWEILSNPTSYQLGVSKGICSRIESFVKLINGFREKAFSINAAELGKIIATESGVASDVFSGKTQEDVTRQENLQGLLDSMYQFVDGRIEEEGDEARLLMSHYLQDIPLRRDLDEHKNYDTDSVSLMTIHAAKGLEFRVVFIVGMEENLFPNQMSASSPRELEEERRLFYVALTRAEEQCFLTYAQNRYRYGKQEFSNPSSFLSEIDGRYLQRESSSSTAPRKRSFSSFSSDYESDEFFTSRFSHSSRESRISDQSSARSQIRDSQSTKNPFLSPFADAQTKHSAAQASPNAGSRVFSSSQHAVSTTQQAVTQTQTAAGTLVVGSHIEHSRFGRGEVIALAGTGIDAKATVRFDNVGTKQLLLRFAKFTIVE